MTKHIVLIGHNIPPSIVDECIPRIKKGLLKKGLAKENDDFCFEGSSTPLAYSLKSSCAMRELKSAVLQQVYYKLPEIGVHLYHLNLVHPNYSLVSFSEYETPPYMFGSVVTSIDLYEYEPDFFDRAWEGLQTLYARVTGATLHTHEE